MSNETSAVAGNKAFHPAAELFPLLTGEEYESFKADIAERGLLEPIWLCDGKILDGRNRYRACLDTDTEPTFREYTGDSPITHVWSLNGKRRHLNPVQLGVIARKMVPQLREEAKKRQATSTGGANPQLSPRGGEAGDKHGKAINQAAKIVGVGHTTVERVDYAATHAPELLPKMESAEISAREAAAIAKAKTEKKPAPPMTKLKRERRAEQIRKLAADGHRAAQIADEIGVGTQHVRDIANQEGIALPDKHIGKARRINARRVIEETVNGLSGFALGLQTINGAPLDIDPADAKEWASSLAKSIKPINRLRKQLSEISDGKA